MGLIDMRAVFVWVWLLAILVFLGMAALKWRGVRAKWAMIGLSLLAAFIAFVVLTTGELVEKQNTRVIGQDTPDGRDR